MLSLEDLDKLKMNLQDSSGRMNFLYNKKK